MALTLNTVGGKPEQEKNIKIGMNGVTVVMPDAGCTLSKITILADVAEEIGRQGAKMHSAEFEAVMGWGAYKAMMRRN